MSDTSFSFHPDEYRHYEAMLAAASRKSGQQAFTPERRSLNEAFMLLLSQSAH